MVRQDFERVSVSLHPDVYKCLRKLSALLSTPQPEATHSIPAPGDISPSALMHYALHKASPEKVLHSLRTKQKTLRLERLNTLNSLLTGYRTEMTISHHWVDIPREDVNNAREIVQKLAEHNGQSGENDHVSHTRLLSCMIASQIQLQSAFLSLPSFRRRRAAVRQAVRRLNG